MTWQRILTLLAAIALGAGAWRAGGGAGLALLVTGLLLWFLLYYTRLMAVMKRAANRPIGYVGSAVMLNARLKPRMPLLNVVALTHSLGERMSAEGVEPEVYRWRDPGDSHVTAEFEGGRLMRWQLERPPMPDAPVTTLPTPDAES
ncbi:MAG: glycerate kinase [Pseudomonadota bacterium]|nr:glycerate kinase [Pseudomonadota bacterium]